MQRNGGGAPGGPRPGFPLFGDSTHNTTGTGNGARNQPSAFRDNRKELRLCIPRYSLSYHDQPPGVNVWYDHYLIGVTQFEGMNNGETSGAF